MKKVLLLLGLWLTLLPVIFILRTHETLVMSNYPVLSNVSDDYAKENKQQISNELIKVLKDEQKAFDDYIANKNISNTNKDVAFLKHMNNVEIASHNLSRVVYWIINEDKYLSYHQNDKMVLKTLYGIKYRFYPAETDDGIPLLNKVELTNFPPINIICNWEGDYCFQNLDTRNYYIDKYKGKISDKTLQRYYNLSEEFSPDDFNEIGILNYIINAIYITLTVLSIVILKALWDMYGQFIPVKKWGKQWLNSIVERFSTMKLWYKIILVISGIILIGMYILSMKNINVYNSRTGSYLLYASIPFFFFLLSKGIVLRLLVAYLFASMVAELARFNSIYIFRDDNFIVYLILLIIAYIIYILFHIAMKFVFKYIKSKIDFERIKSYFTKQTIITIAAIIALIGIISIHKSVQVPKCDSKFAEETVIRIFKQNDHIYEHNIDNVSYIKMSEFTPIDYDKDINKYTCNAKLTMYANPDSPILFLGAYKSFKYNVRYEIYKERGKNTAKASWEMLNIGAQEFAN